MEHNLRLSTEDIDLIIRSIDICIERLESQLEEVSFKTTRLVSVYDKIPEAMQDEITIEEQIEKLVQLKDLLNLCIFDEINEEELKSKNPLRAFQTMYLKGLSDMYNLYKEED